MTGGGGDQLKEGRFAFQIKRYDPKKPDKALLKPVIAVEPKIKPTKNSFKLQPLTSRPNEKLLLVGNNLPDKNLIEASISANQVEQ